jgi:hypothetical protein
VFEQQGAFAAFLKAFRDCCQLKPGIYLPVDNGQITALSQVAYEVPNDASPCESRSALMVHTSMIDSKKCNDPANGMPQTAGVLLSFTPRPVSVRGARHRVRPEVK